MKNKQGAQTVVIGSLLLLGLAVGIVVFIQVSILPDVNERNELDTQESSLESMIELRSKLQTNLATGVSTSMLFENSVSYLPQPAAPPDQFGQLNFGSGEMAVRNAEMKIGEKKDSNGSTTDITRDLEINTEKSSVKIDDAVTVYEYIPSYIELTSEDRHIKMDNTMIYENNPADRRIKHVDQSIVSGKSINLIATQSNVGGVKQQRDMSMVVNSQYTISEQIRGDGGNIVIETYTNEDDDSDLVSSLESNQNVQKASISGTKLEIYLDPTPQYGEYYSFNFVRTRIEVE